MKDYLLGFGGQSTYGAVTSEIEKKKKREEEAALQEPEMCKYHGEQI